MITLGAVALPARIWHRLAWTNLEKNRLVLTFVLTFAPALMQVLDFERFGGKGIRTPGLLIANETLYQLSYTPI